jgi:phosphoglucosamine mutase
VPETDGSIPRLFGTDGVRGTAGRYPLDPSTIRRLGAALVRVLPPGVGTARLLVGRDTRESGAWIESELAGGASGEQAEATSVGVVPTPAVAYLSRAAGFDIGVMISASHNPFDDNGIKVFSGHGQKFTEQMEREVERIVADGTWQPSTDRVELDVDGNLPAMYLEHLRSVVPETVSLRGLKLAVDCANGATAPVAPGVFRAFGIQTVVVADNPDGRNINLACGSTHPEHLARTVVAAGCQLGVAFDGDGDRAIFVDHAGHVVNGDAVLLLCGRQLQLEGRLRGNSIVATVMSNIGLELALRNLNIGLVRCAVGDKYVMEEMLSRGLSLGGEQSGHVIFSDYLFTGDGLCTALNVLRVVALTGQSLADLAAGLVNYPQVLVNVPVRERIELSTVPAIADAMARVGRRLSDQGRLLVRYSGTEPLLRIMIEGQDEGQIRAWAQEIADAVSQSIGR